VIYEFILTRIQFRRWPLPPVPLLPGEKGEPARSPLPVRKVLVLLRDTSILIQIALYMAQRFLKYLIISLSLLVEGLGRGTTRSKGRDWGEAFTP